MRDNKAIHILARPNTPAILVRFIHFADGKEHKYMSAINDLTGDRLTAFDNDPPTIGHTFNEVLKVVRNIQKKSKILEIIGDQQNIDFTKIIVAENMAGVEKIRKERS